MSKQQKATTPNLKDPERITLAASAAVIILSFIVIGTPYVTFSWMFLLIVVADLIVLVRGEQSEIVRRIVLLFSILGALFAVWYAIGAHFPWLLH